MRPEVFDSDPVRSEKIGVLLINLGTPEALTLKAIRRYLKDFLTDPYVLPLPKYIRSIVGRSISYCRANRSLHYYQSIWTEAGSPLWQHTKALVLELQKNLSEAFVVQAGMRYGAPSISEALVNLREAGCCRFVILPLFAQYATATSSSALQEVKQWFSQGNHQLYQWRVIPEFFSDEGYIHSLATVITNIPEAGSAQYLLMSYHGIPDKQRFKSDCQKNACEGRAPCPGPQDSCYRAQCYVTSGLLAKALGLKGHQWGVAFQSRMRPGKWISPYIQEFLAALRQQGIEDLLVVCPSFVADCLETLEEVDIRLKNQWMRLGGKTWCRVPALNAQPVWIETVAQWIRKTGFQTIPGKAICESAS